MFVANVFIGASITFPEKDKSLIMPPKNEKTGHEYDSIKANTGGSDIIIVYSNKKAYPQYLITYTTKWKVFKFFFMFLFLFYVWEIYF